MIITFCGHADFSEGKAFKAQALEYLEHRIGDLPALFYLGGYGGFDQFAFSCCKTLQITHPYTRLIYISPYLSESFQRNHLDTIKDQYDEILYPDIEHVPPKYAIAHRNRWMIERADAVVAYITRTYGGAYQTYLHARRKHKEIFNLHDLNIP